MPAPETAGGGEREAYREAFDLLKDGDLAGARRAFRDVLGRYPQGRFADNARYWLGEIGYQDRDFAAASIQFERLIADYPLSPKVPDAMLKLGYIHDEQGDAVRARTVLDEVVARFPDSTAASLARNRLQEIDAGRR